jgi:hypothetical protein
MSLMAPIIDLPDVNAGIALGAKTKFAPRPLISEGTDGQVVFAEEARLASSRSREMAQLFYQQGIKETRLVNARRWRDVQTQHSPEEINRAEEIIGALDLLRKHALLIKKLRREERKADPNPFRLQSLDAQIEHLHPLAQVAGELVASASNRELAIVRVLRELSKLDRMALRWKSKAQRQIACGLYGMQYDAQKCGRAYFVPFYCRNRYCPHCGPLVHRTLLQQYLRLQQPIAKFLTSHPLYRLRILDITAIKRGERMPSSEDVLKFKDDVGKLIEAANRYIAEKFGVSCSKQLTGYLYCLEFGFENSNLHCHGVLLSPYLEQPWLSDRWREIRNDGSFRVVIAEAYSFEAAIKHALEYTGKYAAPSAERAFELELAFAGRRRVDGLGWFFNRLPKEDVAADVRCPCGDPECFLKPNRDLGWLPLSHFQDRGIPCLSDAQERNRPPTGHMERGVPWVY